MPSPLWMGLAVMKRSLRKEVVVIAIAARASDERIPVVLERLESSDRRAVLSESDDLVPAFVERVVQTPQGGKIATGGPAQNALQPDLHAPAIGGAQHVAELLFDRPNQASRGDPGTSGPLPVARCGLQAQRTDQASRSRGPVSARRRIRQLRGDCAAIVHHTRGRSRWRAVAFHASNREATACSTQRTSCQSGVGRALRGDAVNPSPR
jgi:hypothetical protein